jgi:hypothetical protein
VSHRVTDGRPYRFGERGLAEVYFYGGQWGVRNSLWLLLSGNSHIAAGGRRSTRRESNLANLKEAQRGMRPMLCFLKPSSILNWSFHESR